MSKMIEAGAAFQFYRGRRCGEIPFTPEVRQRASFYPLVGAVIGFIVGGLGLGLSYVFPSSLPSSCWLYGWR